VKTAREDKLNGERKRISQKEDGQSQPEHGHDALPKTLYFKFTPEPEGLEKAVK